MTLWVLSVLVEPSSHFSSSKTKQSHCSCSFFDYALNFSDSFCQKVKVCCFSVVIHASVSSCKRNHPWFSHFLVVLFFSFFFFFIFF